MIDEVLTKIEDAGERILGKESRIKKFSRFLTGYMGTSSIVTAALPIPVGSMHLLPAFASQEKFMNTYTSIACFLVFAYLFYCRHTFARWMFARRGVSFGVRFWVLILPAILILCSMGCAIQYHCDLGRSLDELAAAGARVPSHELLSKIDAREIPGSGTLIVVYLGMFIFAEAAFVLMAIREYLQDTLGLEERELIFGVDPKKMYAKHIDEKINAS
jgi:hypothetical protein